MNTNYIILLYFIIILYLYLNFEREILEYSEGIPLIALILIPLSSSSFISKDAQ